MRKKITPTTRRRRKPAHVPNGAGSAADTALAQRKAAQSAHAHAIWQAQVAADRAWRATRQAA